MGGLQMNNQLNALRNKQSITDEDVLMLRRDVFSDGVVSRAEADALFALDGAVSDKSKSFVSFFVEAVTDYLIMVEAPKGYISQQNADWLIASISADGVVETASELEVLMRCMEKADSMPAELSAFALRQIENAVVNGEGAFANGRNCANGVVTEDDVKMLRRVLYSYSGDKGLSISRAEAEVLFDINDKTSEADNDAAWTDLFTKAIAFSLMAAVGHIAVDRDEALRREEWLSDTSVSVGDFMSGMFAGGLRGIFSAMKADSSVEAAYRKSNAAFEANNAVAERLDAEEAKWLVERIGRDGILHANESALIAFLKKESPDLHPSLQPLLDKVA